MRAEFKRSLLRLFYPNWKGTAGTSDGYTIVLPAPMDMPFLTYLALKGLQDIDLLNCREILVVPDGCGKDGGRAVSEAIKASGAKNVRMLPVRTRQRNTIVLFGHSGIAHWATIVEAIDQARTKWLFLHDVDAFFMDPSLVEASYRCCASEGLHSLGVTARWDPQFEKLDMKLPGTWELMFSSPWARRWAPVDHKAGPRDTEFGRLFFDTMLFPQFMDYQSGKIQVRESDSFLHLSGTVVTYRRFLDFSGRRVGDELFRILFLSLLKDLSPHFISECRLPSVAELAISLTKPNVAVHYAFPGAARNYAQFREFVTDLSRGPLFRRCGQKIEELLKPFDSHFSGLEVLPDNLQQPRMRSHGLWLG